MMTKNNKIISIVEINPKKELPKTKLKHNIEEIREEMSGLLDVEHEMSPNKKHSQMSSFLE